MTPYEAASIAAATDSNNIAIVAVVVAAAIAIVGFIVIFRQGKVTNGALAVLANQGEALKAQGATLEALVRRMAPPGGAASDRGPGTAEPAPLDAEHDAGADCGGHPDRRVR